MRLTTQVLIGGILAIGSWSAAGIGANMGRSDPRNGGEAGWYFSCTYLTPHNSFEVNYTYAARAPEGSAPFWEKRLDCPSFMHQSQATMGWRR